MRQALSVIVPAYNEEEHLEATLEEVVRYLREGGHPFEVLVVNDGSTDGTLEILERAAKKFREIVPLHQNPNQGKGEAVKRGVREARHPICLFLDADNSTSIREWKKFEAYFKAGAKAVIASRHLSGSEIRIPQPWARRFLGGCYRGLCRSLFDLSASDFNCGFKAYQAPIAKAVYERLQMRDWTFDVEIFMHLKKAGISVQEVPVRWTHYGKKGGLPPVRTALKSLRSLCRLKWTIEPQLRSFGGYRDL